MCKREVAVAGAGADVSEHAKYLRQIEHRLEPFLKGIALMARMRKAGIWCQGRHTVTGATAVVTFDLSICNRDSVRQLINDFFFGNRRADVMEFLDRVQAKVEGAYCVELQINGYDADGDMVDAKLEFPSQTAFAYIAENGLFRLEDTSEVRTLIGG